MIDESTDVSVNGHVVVFVTFVGDGLSVSIFLGLLKIANGRKYAEEIFQMLLTSMKEWGLDLGKCVAFGSDGCSTMVGSKSGVATRLKDVSPFIIAVHCIAHRTNLVTLQAAESSECKVVSSEIDNTINLLAAHFKKSGKKKTILHAIQKELNDVQKTLKKFHKIRWLSRSEAITTLCDSLESVLIFFKDVPKEKGDSTIPLLYEKLRSFKFIYILYFLADLLHGLSILCKIFQRKYVDTTILGSIVRNEIESIRLLYIMENTDLNECTFNESTCYHVIPSFGPPNGYLMRLSSEIREAKFHLINMIRNRT